MSYIYTRPSPKTHTAKYVVAALAILAAIATFLMMTGPKSKPTPLATQPMVIEMVETEATTKAEFKIPEALTYRAIDNAIRDVQIDNAHLGHKLKMAVISEDSPVRRGFSSLNRKFSFMAILVTLAFAFTLIALGLVRSPGSDLENY